MGHAEDLVSENVQSELQAALKKDEALQEDFALQSRAREALTAQVRLLKPEIVEADERCRHLEAKLAQRSRELEAELAQQRDAKQEIACVSDSLRRLQHQEAQVT